MPNLSGTGTDSVPTKEGLTANSNAKPESPPSPCDGSRGGKGGVEAKGNRTSPV